MKFINLLKIARNSSIILGMAVVSVQAQNSNSDTLSNRSNTVGSSANQTTNTTTVTANTPRVEAANTPRVEAANTPRVQATSTPRTEVQTVVEKENGFPWGLLGLLGLAGLIPKKRSVEVTGVRETTQQTRTTTEHRDNNPNR